MMKHRLDEIASETLDLMAIRFDLPQDGEDGVVGQFEKPGRG